MHTWQLQEAKAKLSELLKLCKKEGPQEISVRGNKEAVLLSKKDYDSLTKKTQSLVEFIRSTSFCGVELDLERDKSIARDIDL